MSAVQIDDSGQELTPALLRRRGLRRAVGAEVRLRAGDLAAHDDARSALADLVEAFLHERAGNADLFVRAHRLGAMLSESRACLWQANDDEYTLRCPVFALHRTWATSVALTAVTSCSICGAGEFGCDHVPGETYDGTECRSVVEAIGPMGHIAITADPDFTYTWHQPQSVKTAELLADGIIRRAGDPAYCTHCQDCAGEPSAGDLDPVGRLVEMRMRAEAEEALAEAGGSPGAEAGPEGAG